MWIEQYIVGIWDVIKIMRRKNGNRYFHLIRFYFNEKLPQVKINMKVARNCPVKYTIRVILI